MIEHNIRAIIIKDSQVYLEKTSKYYSFPGKKVVNQNLRKELKEYIKDEFNMNIDVLNRAYEVKADDEICSYYLCNCIDEENEKVKGTFVNSDDIHKYDLVPKKIKGKILKDLEENNIYNIGEL